MVDYKVENFESDVDYNTVLDVFEGPLDLLLHLINCAKIRIEDVFVSQVTSQFLAYIDFMKTQTSRDIDKESEYLTMAAQIIYIKSKSMLPPVDVMGEEVGGAYEEQQELIEQLKQRELELIREETPKLKDLETVGYAFREADEMLSKVKIVYTDFSVDAMLKAFAKLMMKVETMANKKEDVKEIPMDVYTVEDQATYIKNSLLESGGHIHFSLLFKSYTRNEIITTFQALLEMLKHQFVTIEQEENFDEIVININPEWDLKDLTDEQFEEYN